MFVSIDMQNLVFLHKHRDQDTLGALAYLEACDRSFMVENTDREHFLSKLTGLDLRFLYRNTTGLDITGTDPIVVREMLAEIVESKMAPTICIQSEVEAQVAAVVDDLEKGIPWKYSLGSNRPAKQDELFNFHCKPLDTSEAQAAAARAPQRRKAATPAKVRATPTAAPAGPAVPKQRGFNVRPVIWDLADAMWVEAGSPTDVKVVLELRKKMMSALEEKGVKRTSSSNELGNWMKTRLA